MAEYELAPGAELDLLDIARYTLETWGIEQTERYESLLEGHFQALARGKARTRTPIDSRPALTCSRCEHHYVFALVREGLPLLIVAVLHENMDFIARLRERIE